MMKHMKQSARSCLQELKLEESNLRRQLQSLDAAGRPSFVVLARALAWTAEVGLRWASTAATSRRDP